VKKTVLLTADPMRGFILFLTLLFSILAVTIRIFGDQSGQVSGSIVRVAPIGLARLAMVMGALWIAWPAIRKPALWLPPGALFVALLSLAICVVQPRLAIALIPAATLVIAFAGFLRFFRGK
jgi:hypothetical protein